MAAVDFKTVGASAAVVVGSSIGYKLLRPMFRVGVNCWFCNTNLRVDYHASKTGWMCRYCEQYNGFTKDGDYNRDDPNRYQERKVKFTQSRLLQAKPLNTLCSSCNLNQELKIHQISKFEPKHEANFDQEYEEFRAHLERTYRLCRNCEAKVHQVLGEQDSSLRPSVLNWKLDNNEIQRSLSNRKKNLEGIWAIPNEPMRISTFVISFFALLMSYYPPQDIASELYDVTPGERWARRRKTLKDLSHIEQLTTWLHDTIGLTELVLFTLIMISMSRKTSVMFPNSRLNLATIFSWLSLFLVCSLEKADPILYYCQLVISFIVFSTSTAFALDCIYTNISSKSECCSDQSKIVQDQNHQQDPYGYYDSNLEEFDHINATLQNETTVGKNKECDSPCDISSLSIDGDSDHEENDPRPNLKISSYFPNKYNGLSSLDNSLNISFRSQSRPLLRPPRFNPNATCIGASQITRTSWVAGGYWQTSQPSKNHEAEGNLSRSSSQSSGFVSQCSNRTNHHQFQELNLSLPLSGSQAMASWPNSRVNSLCGDQLSVLSEPTMQNPFFRSPTRTNSQAESTLTALDRDPLNEEYIRKTTPPRANSSPISASVTKGSFLERQISIQCSVFSLLLSTSVMLNVLLFAYLSLHFVFGF